jgi:hypothetical protein
MTRSKALVFGVLLLTLAVIAIGLRCNGPAKITPKSDFVDPRLLPKDKTSNESNL